MLTNKTFWIGAVVGIAGWWAFHAFVRPIPSKKAQG